MVADLLLNNKLCTLLCHSLSLVIEPHWSVVAYSLQEGLLSCTANMPSEREASPNLQYYNLAKRQRVGKEEAGDLVMVPIRFRACGRSAGKSALSQWLMIGNLEAGAGERLLEQECATWMHNSVEFSTNLKHALIWLQDLSHFLPIWDPIQESLIMKYCWKKCKSDQRWIG